MTARSFELTHVEDPLMATMALPYPEGAAVAMASFLNDAGRLANLFMPSRQINRALAGVCRRVPGPAASNIAGKLSRGSAVSPIAYEVFPGFELRRWVYRSSPFRTRFSDRLNGLKFQFDAHVARKGGSFSDVVIGMPGASLATFTAGRGATTVYHEVDSHPAVHNELLLDVYTKNSVEKYLHPKYYIDRVNAELAVSDLVLVPSRFVARQMTSLGIPDENIVRVPYGVDLTLFSPSIGMQISTEHDANKTIKLLFAGQLRFSKGVPLLIEAVRGLANVQLTLVGPLVNAEVLDKLPNNVSYLGTLSHERLTQELDHCDAFVYPSLEDNFVLGISEALAMGVPVITTNQVGASEYMHDTDGIIVSAGDVSTLRSVLAALEPLERSARVERAQAFRERGSSAYESLSNSWPEYADSVWQSIVRQHN